MVAERGCKGQNAPTNRRAMAATDSIEGGSTRVGAGVGDVDECVTPLRTQLQEENEDTSSVEAVTPPPVPGEGAGSVADGSSPNSTSSVDTLGSTSLDPRTAAQPATNRELLRLRKAVKETRTALVEDVRQREILEDKLAGRILTLSNFLAESQARKFWRS